MEERGSDIVSKEGGGVTETWIMYQVIVFSSTEELKLRFLVLF